MALNSYPYTDDKLVQSCIKLLTTDGVLEAVCTQSEKVRKRATEVLAAYKPELQGGENIPAEASPVGGYALGQQASQERHRG